jgi:hypothetical protein
MQHRTCRIDETSCNARPDHTFRSKSDVLQPLFRTRADDGEVCEGSRICSYAPREAANAMPGRHVALCACSHRTVTLRTEANYFSVRQLPNENTLRGLQLGPACA